MTIEGILDTCVLIDAALGSVDPLDLPDLQLITSISLGELSFGALATDDITERAARQTRLQAIEATFGSSVLSYDAGAARVFSHVVCADVIRRGRSPRRRLADLQIAAVAIANQLPLYTVNEADFRGIANLQIVPVARTTPV